MTVVFTKAVIRDANSITDAKLKARIAEVVKEIEEVASLQEIRNLKKLQGYSNAYRIRIGNYRLGVEKEGDVLILARFLKRNDIYKLFP